MKKLREPQMPYPPSRYEYEATTERKYIYSYTESLLGDDEEDFDEDEDGNKPNQPEIPVHEVDLAWLMSKVPKGVKPEQIKIEFGYNANCMAYEDHYIKFYYEVDVPARKTEFKLAVKKYKQDLDQYHKDMNEYNKAYHLQQIKEAEARLAKLKKGHSLEEEE